MRTGILTVMLLGLGTGVLWAQAPDEAQPATAPSLMITIPDDPKAVDPATVMPEALSRKVTRDFNKTSLKELTQWARDELKMPVILDSKGLSDLRLLSSEQISDQLKDEPIYLILNRLGLIGLGWYIDDGTLRITSRDQADEHYSTVQYVVSDLLDAKYSEYALISAIEQCTSGPWDADEPGTGTIVLLGDVLFVRQIDRVHWEVASLLSALRKHGRRTILLDLPVHEPLRAKLDQLISVELDETPLDEAIRQLGAAVDVNLRIHPSVIGEGAKVRQPVTLKIEGQRLRTAIQEIGSRMGYELRGMVADGSLWIVSAGELQQHYSTAVFDVRDLCRDDGEADALADAIYSQTEGPWDIDEPGTGVLDFPVPGTMVCRQNPPQLDQVLALLENYRTALRASKPRPRVDLEEEARKVTTHFYRMPREMADDLLKLIPELIAPESWKGDKPAGTIRLAASRSEVEQISRPAEAAADGKKGATSPAAVTTVVSPRSVLIIRQTNAIHREILKLISNIQHGHEPLPDYPTKMGGGMGGGSQQGGGGGGFGGGFFQLPVQKK
jgi:hypothetical protein